MKMKSTTTSGQSLRAGLSETAVRDIAEKTVNAVVVREARVREIAEQLVRDAIRDQARDLEKHLLDIHARLLKLEK